MRLRASAMIVAILCLAACDRFLSPEARVEACVGSFAYASRALNATPPGGVGLRYAFEVRDADPVLLRDGIEGVAPSVTAISGDNVQARTEEEVARLMGATSQPGTVYFPAPPSWLVYAPVRKLSGAEARRHLAAMCALSNRGLVLRRFGVAVLSTSK